jgi:hypothetical protein
MAFFSESSVVPPADAALIRAAEQRLGVRLPASYVALLLQQNGGRPARRFWASRVRTSWADDHVEVTRLLGVGGDEGIDGPLGSHYLVAEWGYPDLGVVVFDTPAAGPDCVMLDYRQCDSAGEPGVVFVDADRTVVALASTFALFVAGLVERTGLPSVRR